MWSVWMLFKLQYLHVAAFIACPQSKQSSATDLDLPS